MEISFEGIVLRPWAFSDAIQLALVADNKKIADNIRDGLPNPYSVKDAQDWLNLILPENNPPRFFAVTTGNQVVGSIGIVTKSNIYRRNFEIKAVISYAFRNFDIVRIYAESFSDNIGSRRALEKAGLKLEATLKKSIIKNEIIKDSCIYSILREDFKDYISN
jgi:RimJ/RimL family protein N-acetyltransferase